MGGQGLADGVEAVGGHAGDMLGCVGGVGQREGNGEADKVDVGDVDEELGGAEGELAEVPGQVYVWVGWIGDGWLDEGGARVEEEGQSPVDREPDTTSTKVGNGDGLGVTGRAQRDGAILAKGRAGRRRRSWVVLGFAIRLK